MLSDAIEQTSTASSRPTRLNQAGPLDKAHRRLEVRGIGWLLRPLGEPCHRPGLRHACCPRRKINSLRISRTLRSRAEPYRPLRPTTGRSIDLFSSCATKRARKGRSLRLRNESVSRQHSRWLLTDAMKSAGAARKGGTSPVNDVLDFPGICQTAGLNLPALPATMWNA